MATSIHHNYLIIEPRVGKGSLLASLSLSHNKQLGGRRRTGLALEDIH